MFLKIVLSAVLVVCIAAEQVRYDNYALYKVHPENEDHITFLKDLENNDGVDFWKAPSFVGEYVSVIASPEIRKKLEEDFKELGIQADTMLENIQEALDAQRRSRRKRSTSPEMYWTNYQTIEEIYDWFHYLASSYSNIVEVITIGQSYEGRNITGIKITRGSGTRGFFLEAGEIGADWLSPTVLTYIANELIFSNNTEVQAAAEAFTWYIFPLVNPDGHQFTQDSVRFWMKNRRPIRGNAIGVDLSRNWNSQWGVSGGSHRPQDSNFIGIGPFSEPETRAMSRYIESIASSLSAFLSFRSFGQRLLIPFAHSSDPLYNYNETVTIGRRAMGSMAVRYNTQYIVGTSRNVHDGSTGTVSDWVKYRFNPPVVATYLLRDTGVWGYTLPVNQITPTCEETFDSLMAIIREARFINVF